MEEFVQAAIPFGCDGFLKLFFDSFVIDGAFDIAEDTHWFGEFRKSHAREHKGKARLIRFFVVEEEIVLGNTVSELDDFWTIHFVDTDAFIAVFSEDERFAVFEVDDVVGFLIFFGGVGEGTGIEDVAILIDLDEGCSLVMGGTFEDVGEVLDIDIDGASGKRGFRADGDAEGGDGIINGSVRSTFGTGSEGAGRGVLSLGEPVNLVVKQDNVEVNVTADGMHEVVAADGERVSVSGDHPDLHIGACDFDAGCNRGRTTMDTVEPVGVHVVREPAGAADARDEHELFLGEPKRGKNFFHLGENGIVAAARAPADFLVTGEILGGQNGKIDTHDIQSCFIEMFLWSWFVVSKQVKSGIQSFLYCFDNFTDEERFALNLIQSDDINQELGTQYLAKLPGVQFGEEDFVVLFEERSQILR